MGGYRPRPGPTVTAVVPADGPRAAHHP